MSIINEALKKASEKKIYISDFISEPTKDFGRVLNINELQRMAWQRRKWVLFGGISGTIVASVVVFTLFFSKDIMVQTPDLITSDLIRPSEPAVITPQETQEIVTVSKKFEDYLKVPTLSLTGVTKGRGKGIAVINNRIMNIGDHIDGASLVRINNDNVIMVYKGQEFILRIK